MAASIGAVSETCGVRPSTLFEWTDSKDWAKRLLFDMKIISTYKQKQAEAMKDANKN